AARSPCIVESSSERIVERWPSTRMSSVNGRTPGPRIRSANAPPAKWSAGTTENAGYVVLPGGGGGGIGGGTDGGDSPQAARASSRKVTRGEAGITGVTPRSGPGSRRDRRPVRRAGFAALHPLS